MTLRAFTEEDADSYHRILCGRDVLRYFPRPEPPPRDRVDAMIQAMLRHWQAHGYGLWAVESRATGEFAGRSGLQLIPETGEVELDVILGDAFWGRGLATEACRAGLRFGFATLGPRPIVGIVHPENRASLRLVEKLGFTHASRARYFDMDCERFVIEGPDLERLYGAAPAPG